MNYQRDGLKKYLHAVKWLITISLLLFIFWKIGWNRIIDSFCSIGILHFTVSLLLAPIYIGIKAKRWHLLIRASSGSNYTEALMSVLVGLAFGFLTPGRLGEFSRIAFINSDNKFGLAYLFVIDRIFELSIVMLLSIVGVFKLLGIHAGAVLTLLTAIVIFFLYNQDKLRRTLQFTKLRLLKRINRLITGQKIVNAKLTTQCIGWSSFTFFILFFQLFLLISGFQAIEQYSVIAFFPLIVLGNILPITIGGLGTREGLAVFILSKANISAQTAISSSLLLFFVDIVLPAITGGILILRIKKVGKKLIKSGEDAMK